MGVEVGGCSRSARVHNVLRKRFTRKKWGAERPESIDQTERRQEVFRGSVLHLGRVVLRRTSVSPLSAVEALPHKHNYHCMYIYDTCILESSTGFLRFEPKSPRAYAAEMSPKL